MLATLAPFADVWMAFSAVLTRVARLSELRATAALTVVAGFRWAALSP